MGGTWTPHGNGDFLLKCLTEVAPEMELLQASHSLYENIIQTKFSARHFTKHFVSKKKMARKKLATFFD